MESTLMSYKRDFDYDREERAFIGFMKILFIIFALIFVWNVYSHFNQIKLVKNGTGVLASIYTVSSGERISFVAEDGKTYWNNVSGMFLPEHEDTIMVYYIDNPASAMPLTSNVFFYSLYGLSIGGMIIFGCLLHRMQKNMIKTSTPVKDEE